MKKRVISILLAGAMMLSLAACDSSAGTAESKSVKGGESTTEKEAEVDAKDAKVTFLLPTLQAEFFVTVGESGEKYLEDQGYANVSVESYDMDATKCIESVENCIANEVDIIAVMPLDNSVDDALRQAREAGITVVSCGVQTEEFDYCLLADNTDAGEKIAEMAADWVNKHFDGKTQIAAITTTASTDMIARCDGMITRLKELLPESEIVMEGNAMNAGEGSAFAENLLQKYPKCQVVVSYGDAMAVEVVEVYKAAGLAGEDTGIFGNDATGQALQEIADGDILRGTIDMGDIGSMMAERVIKWQAKEIEAGTIEVGENIKVTSENISDYVK